MQEAVVLFKGTVNGLTIILREEDDFTSILSKVQEKVEGAGKFFKGATLTVTYKGKRLTKDQEDSIFDFLSKNSGARIKSVSREPEEPILNNNVIQQPKIKLNNHYFKGIDQGPTRFHRGTVRSGQLVRYEGNLVVLGDVNPGGEVVACGNVIVMGTLKGMVHAGADGNRDAIVVALNLQPMQLRISDVITRSPDENEEKMSQTAEMAFVKDDQIIIVNA